MRISSFHNPLFKLLKYSDQEARSDFSRIQELLEMIPERERGDDYDALIQSTLSRIEDARKFRKYLLYLIVLVVIVSLLFSGYRMFRNDKIAEDNAIIDLARSSTLPLRVADLGSNNDWVNVTISKQLSDISEKQRAAVIRLTESLPSLGRIYEMGNTANLSAFFSGDGDESVRLVLQTKGTISAKSFREDNINSTESSQANEGQFGTEDGNVSLGFLDIRSRTAEIAPISGKADSRSSRQQFPLGLDVEYLDDNAGSGIGFFVRVSLSSDQSRWQFQFGEKAKSSERNNNVIRRSKIYSIRRDSSDLLELMLYNREWSAIYSVTINSPRFGEDPDSGQQYAWSLRSVVRRLRFQ